MDGKCHQATTVPQNICSSLALLPQSFYVLKLGAGPRVTKLLFSYLFCQLYIDELDCHFEM